MPRAKKMCPTCPFRGIRESEKRELAVVEADAWGCHEENPYGWTDIQCRGHFEAQKKYPPTEHEVPCLRKWQDEFSAAFALSVLNGTDIDKLPLAPTRDEMNARTRMM